MQVVAVRNATLAITCAPGTFDRERLEDNLD